VGSTETKESDLLMKPLETLSDDELNRLISGGELGDRKAAIGAEILRRRRQTRVEEWKRSGWFGAVVASLALVFWGFKRLWQKS
jgi:hypothetical protein